MITGFNSDIEYGGKVFHVQTEEKGLDNPVVLTLVYCGGEIVTSIEASYADLVDDESTPEGEIRRRMSDQHQDLIQDIRRGRFTPTQMPYGHDLISDRSLDELVLNYLEDEIAEQTAKVGRVLNKLERFLTAAERARVEGETPAETAEVETPEESTEEDSPEESVEMEAPVEATAAIDETFEATETEPDVAVPTTERRKRKAGWIWAAAAAAIIVGVTGWFMFSGDRAADRPAEPSRPTPAVESNEESIAENTERQAGVAVLPIVPTPAAEPAAEPTPDNASADRPVETTPPETVFHRLTPVPPRDPAPEASPVEAAPVVTPEPSITPTPPESDEAGVVEDPVVMLDEVDVSPMARQRDLPRYTRRARRLQQEGVVKLRIQIDSHGEVAEVVMLSGIPDSDLNEAAVEVAHGWTFSAARKNGRRVRVWKEVAFEFTVRADRTTSVRIHE